MGLKNSVQQSFLKIAGQNKLIGLAFRLSNVFSLL